MLRKLKAHKDILVVIRDTLVVLCVIYLMIAMSAVRSELNTHLEIMKLQDENQRMRNEQIMKILEYQNVVNGKILRIIADMNPNLYN